MQGAKANILVVEDDPAILNGLLDVLTFNGYGVDGVDDGKEGLEKALSEAYDLVLLDVMLPNMDGFAICKALREKKPTQPIVMLTAKGSEDDVVTGFKAGADDYVTKPFSLRELMVRVEAVLRRAGKLGGEEQVNIKDMCFNGATLKLERKGKSVELTRREMDIVSYLLRFKERIVSKKELLTEVWHYGDADIETRTVDIHIQKLRKKITEVFGDEPVILTIRGQGYRLSPELAAE